MFASFGALRFVLLAWLSAAYFVQKGRTVPSSHYVVVITGFFGLIVVSEVSLFLRLFKRSSECSADRNT